MLLQGGFENCLVRYDYTVQPGLGEEAWLILAAYLFLGLVLGYLIGHFVGERCTTQSVMSAIRNSQPPNGRS